MFPQLDGISLTHIKQGGAVESALGLRPTQSGLFFGKVALEGCLLVGFLAVHALGHFGPGQKTPHLLVVAIEPNGANAHQDLAE